MTSPSSAKGGHHALNYTNAGSSLAIRRDSNRWPSTVEHHHLAFNRRAPPRCARTCRRPHRPTIVVSQSPSRTFVVRSAQETTTPSCPYTAITSHLSVSGRVFAVRRWQISAGHEQQHNRESHTRHSWVNQQPKTDGPNHHFQVWEGQQVMSADSPSRDSNVQPVR